MVDKHIALAAKKFSTHCTNIPIKQDGSFLKFPVFPSATKNLEKILGTHQIKLGLTPGTQIKNICANFKDKIIPRNISNVVYNIKCTGCDKVCVGETVRNILARAAEHVRALKYNDTNYHTVIHQNETGHIIDIKSMCIVHRAQHFRQRKMLEATFISSMDNFNGRSGNAYVSDIWKPYLHNLKIKSLNIF